MNHRTQTKNNKKGGRLVIPFAFIIFMFVIAGCLTQVFQQNSQVKISTPPPDAPQLVTTAQIH